VKLIFRADESNQGQRVPSGLYWQSRFFSQTKPLWKWLGDVESTILAEDIESQAIKSPVYVCGLARSGTTIITEMLNAHEQLTCHRYSDFPNIYTPYWRNWLLQRSQFQTVNAVERAHKDGLLVTRDSAEAVEELLWMYFFPETHNPEIDQRLDSKTENLAFERYYRQHIAKLLFVREKQRYLAKGNYNISRIGYISKLFPDASFIVPIRHPIKHIVSLYKQHKLFLDLQAQDNRTARQLAMSGHYEFGPQRRCPNFGDRNISQKIAACWSQGSELQGWAWLWRQVYDQVKQNLDDPKLKDRIMWLRYEDLCGEPASTIDAILRHCDLPSESFSDAREHYKSTLRAQNYYRFEVEDNILTEIWDIVSPVAESFGYSRPA
jgi:hypothetical protein